MRQEGDFLANIFEHFDRNVIDQVIEEFPNLDAAYIHLSEFLGMEEEKIEDQPVTEDLSETFSGFDSDNIYNTPDSTTALQLTNEMLIVLYSEYQSKELIDRGIAPDSDRDAIGPQILGEIMYSFLYYI